MPKLLARPMRGPEASACAEGAEKLMALAEARKFYLETPAEVPEATPSPKAAQPRTALEQVCRHKPTVIIGQPGSGKSTFLEWLQVRVASGEEELIAGD